MLRVLTSAGVASRSGVRTMSAISAASQHIAKGVEAYTPDMDRVGGYDALEVSGVDIDLNWALARQHFITPNFHSYRNASVPELCSLAYGNVSSVNTLMKQVVVSHPEVKSLATPTFVVGQNGGNAELPRHLFNQLRRDVRRYLSKVATLCVEDGAVGATKSAEDHVRVICDTSVGALQWDVLLSKSAFTVPNDHVDASSGMTVYFAPGLSGNFAPYGIDASDFVVSNLARREIVVVGAVPVETVQNTMVNMSVAAHHAAEAGSFVNVPADMVGSSLLVGADKLYKSNAGAVCAFCLTGVENVHAQRSVLLSVDTGIASRGFGGATTSMPDLLSLVAPQNGVREVDPWHQRRAKKHMRAYIVEERDGATVSSFKLPSQTVSGTVGNVVVFTEDGPAVSSATSEQAADAIVNLHLADAVSMGASVDNVKKAVTGALSASGASLYLVNAAKADKSLVEGLKSAIGGAASFSAIGSSSPKATKTAAESTTTSASAKKTASADAAEKPAKETKRKTTKRTRAPRTRKTTKAAKSE